MKKLSLLSILIILICAPETSFGQEIKPDKINFPSIDGLLISANMYHNNDKFPIILLCHQARYNKSEYDEIAVKLYKKGFNLIAIDQRSGGTLFGKENETFAEATKLGKPTSYLNAEQDIEAAINFAYNKYNQKIILWGSSYSSTLALYFACSNDKIRAVLTFSPGNYFAEQKGSLITKLKTFNKPLFATSSSEEAPKLTNLLSEIAWNKNQVQFIPTEKGKHGSKALWKNNVDNKEYWKALNSFLKKLKNI